MKVASVAAIAGSLASRAAPRIPPCWRRTPSEQELRQTTLALEVLLQRNNGMLLLSLVLLGQSAQRKNGDSPEHPSHHHRD